MATSTFNRFSILLFWVGILCSSTLYAGDFNKTDQNGQRQGYWVITGSMSNDKSYTPAAKVEEGVYKDSHKEGLWKKYWPNGKIRSEIVYNDGRPQGGYKLYYENGNVEEQGFWSNNKNAGEFKRFYENGNPQQHFYFSDNGRRNGWQKYYHDNGKLALEVNVVNGQESGVCKRYNVDGSLAEEKTYDKGVVKEGSIKRYKETSKKALPTNDTYDEKIGKESVVVKDKVNKADSFNANGFNTLYDKNGHITQSGEFRDGKLLNGKWYHYNSNGILIRIEIYKNGRYVGTGIISESDL